MSFNVKFFQTKEDIRRVIRDTCQCKIVKVKTGEAIQSKTKIFELSLADGQFYGKDQFCKMYM